MRARKLDNFKRWRDEMKRIGKIKSSYPALKKSGNLAELIGTVLGDGHIAKHPRCDSLRIVGDAAKMGFVYRAAMLVEIVFAKKPAVAKRTSSNAVTVTIYERKISERLGVPATVLLTEPFAALAASFSATLGMPDYPVVVVPHPVSSKPDEHLRAIAAAAADAAAARLTGASA